MIQIFCVHKWSPTIELWSHDDPIRHMRRCNRCDDLWFDCEDEPKTPIGAFDLPMTLDIKQKKDINKD